MDTQRTLLTLVGLDGAWRFHGIRSKLGAGIQPLSDSLDQNHGDDLYPGLSAPRTNSAGNCTASHLRRGRATELRAVCPAELHADRDHLRSAGVSSARVRPAEFCSTDLRGSTGVRGSSGLLPGHGLSSGNVCPRDGLLPASRSTEGLGASEGLRPRPAHPQSAKSNHALSSQLGRFRCNLRGGSGFSIGWGSRGLCCSPLAVAPSLKNRRKPGILTCGQPLAFSTSFFGL